MTHKIPRYTLAAGCLILATSLFSVSAQAQTGRLVAGNGVLRFIGNNEDGRFAVTRLIGEDSPLLITRFTRGDGDSDGQLQIIRGDRDSDRRLSLIRLTRIVEFGDARNPRDFHNYGGGDGARSSSLAGLGAADADMQ